MIYDPFGRGPFPVGVRSGEIVDGSRSDRTLPFEVWYPAAARYFAVDLVTWTQDGFSVVPGGQEQRQAAVRDATPQDGTYPLVVYSHPSAGHRRQSSFLCTHLASHGYVVAAVDHAGNTALDFVEHARGLATGTSSSEQPTAPAFAALIAQRVPDVRFLMDQLLSGAAGEINNRIDAERIGLAGWSFGGWTVLALPEVDERIGAIAAMAPAGASQPEPGVLPLRLTFEWQRKAPTLFLAGETDRLTPLSGLYELFGRTPAPKQMYILRKAGHYHFGDEIDEYDLCSRQDAHCFTRSLTLAHFDATLKSNRDAEHLMHDEAVALLQAKGVDAVAYMDGSSL